MPDIFYPSRAAIEGVQLGLVQRLLKAVRGHNRFYTAKLDASGVPETILSLDQFSKTVPFTTKSEVVSDQSASPPYGTNLTHPLERYTRFHQTSGTTGAPLRWLDSPESWEWMLVNWTTVFRAAGVTPADHILFAFSFGPFLGFWLAFEAGARLGCMCIPTGGLSSVARLRVLLDNRATVLCCTPTYAIRLAEVAAQERVDLAGSRVRTIMVAGEAGGSIPATRARISELWRGARVFDHHGMTEVGPVTFECPARGGVLHVIETGYLAEIINSHTGEPVEPGQTGELVLTTLGRIGSPLIRYRTGDLVKASASPSQSGAPCACGRHDLALEGGILGRSDDMVIVRGVNVYPSAIEEIVRACDGVAEYQVTVRSTGALAEMAIRIEPAAAASANASDLGARLERDLQNALSLRIPVSLAPIGSLPRFEMKAKRWLRLVT